MGKRRKHASQKARSHSVISKKKKASLAIMKRWGNTDKNTLAQENPNLGEFSSRLLCQNLAIWLRLSLTSQVHLLVLLIII